MVELTLWLSLGDIPVWSALLTIAIVLIYVDWRVTFSYFTKLGIPGPRPWPLIGHTFHVAFYGELHSDLMWSQQYGKVYGHFRGRTPFLVVRDNELLQSILVKDFANFCDRGPGLLATKPLDRGLFFLFGNEWRELRALMSPTFSSGKLKQMFHLINSCAENLTDGFVKAAKSGNSVKVKELFGAYTNDAIAVTAFGLNINSFQDPDNLFLKNGKKVFELKYAPLLQVVAWSPYVMKIMLKIGLGSFPKDALQFFTKAILLTIEERKSQKGKQHVDFLQLLMNAEADEENTSSASKGSKKKLTVDEIVAQSFLFFGAGYETTASTLTYMVYNLAMHPEYAENIYREIIDVLGDDEPNYESLSKMVYLEQCINETLRLQTPVHTMTRLAKNDIKIGQYKIPAGTCIHLPYYGIHHDPENYPNPQEFDPERFSESAKASRHPMAFSPFGQGPRICIAVRLALLEAKLAMVHLIRKIRFVRCPETPAHLTFLPIPILLLSEPIVIRAEMR